MIGSWSGLRGAVSLAAALAVPLSTAAGAPIAHRDLIIFLTFTVILVTLVGGGLTLPLVARGVVAPDADDEDSETTLALHTLSDAAADELETLRLAGHVTASEALTLSALYTSVEEMPGGSESSVGRRNTVAERAIIHAQRTALRRLRKDGTIDNVVLRRINRSLDAAEVALPTKRSSQ